MLVIDPTPFRRFLHVLLNPPNFILISGGRILWKRCILAISLTIRHRLEGAWRKHLEDATIRSRDRHGLSFFAEKITDQVAVF